MLDQLYAISNELLLLILAVLVISIGMFRDKSDGKAEVILATLGLSALFAADVLALFPQVRVFGDTYYAGPVERVFKAVFLLAGALTALLSWPGQQKVELISRDRIGEHLGLLILSIIGMCFLISAKELVLLYVSLELVTIPLILLVAFNRHELRSAEAGIKYVLFSALSSGILLFGLSFVYGMTGTTYLAGITPKLSLDLLTIVSLVLVMAGVGFKISAAPFHLWTPDTYEGAPLPVTTFLSVASKAAGFALFFKVITVAFGGLQAHATTLICILATITMTFGNLVALYQTNMKRFLAFSSIAQAGYLLIGLANTGELGLTSVLFYLLVYLVSNIAAFGVVTIIAAATGKEDMRDYVGFSVANPKLAAVMMLAMFSLAGIPPLAGFLGKFYLFAAAAQKGLYWLIFVAVINATVSLFYYLMVIKWMYLVKTEEGREFPRVPVSFAGGLVLAVTTVTMLAFGLMPQALRWVETAAASGL
ncbi:MAG: NADH-quinone oxidoreductase subunit N [Verrucomicrobia bacterium]|nr:NADH-quinone oxidoreductase subunit N [Verrucomicrobiota bacterium]